MRLLLAYARRYWRLVALALLFAAASQILLLIDPLIARRLVDQYAMRHGAYSTGEFVRIVGLWVLAAVAIAVLSRMAKTVQDYFVSVVIMRLGADLYTDGIRHSLELPYARFEDQRSGETLGTLQRVRSDVEKLVTVSINTLFTALIAVVFVAVYAVTVHWVILPVLFLSAPVIGILSAVLSRRIKAIQRKIVKETTALAGSSTESLRNIELVKSLGLAPQEIARLNGITEKIVGLELHKVRAVRLLSFMQGTMVIGMRTSILFVMMLLIYRGDLTVGQWFSLWLYSFYVFGPLQDMGTVINTYRETEASLENFKAILALPVETAPPDPVHLGPLESLAFEAVGFTYQSATHPALAEITFQARRGETIAFVGPSGAGKSTLVKLLVGLYIPPSGRILYNGVPQTAIDLAALRVQTGFVTQDTQLFSGTIRENLRFVASQATDAECRTVLTQAACDSLMARSSQGLDTMIGEGGIKISGGEKQRLSIARALLRAPRLLVFDEATSSLDSLTEDEVTQTIRTLASTKVITILIAHRLSTILHADTIHVLERGRIVETGRHQDLLDRKGLYYAMWRQQVGERPSSLVIPDVAPLPAAALTH